MVTGYAGNSRGRGLTDECFSTDKRFHPRFQSWLILLEIPLSRQLTLTCSKYNYKISWFFSESYRTTSNHTYLGKQNGYKKYVIVKSLKKQGLTKKPTNLPEEVKKEKLAVLPYVKGSTDKIGSVLRKYNIKTVLFTNHTVQLNIYSAQKTKFRYINRLYTT